MNKRVPAEWEEQEAVWLQWPGVHEKSYEQAFAQFSAIISRYQTLHILYHSDKILEDAKAAIENHGDDVNHKNIQWHPVPYDSAWMRDNGPVYVIEDNAYRIQNWEFNAWGGAFGRHTPCSADNRVPDHVAELTGLPVDHVAIVHERGNLEFNGVDTVILNWSTIGDPRRNPGYTRVVAEKDLKHHFGVNKVVFVEGFVPDDLTRGHIDGLARFINADTVVVPQCTANSLCQPDEDTGRLYDQVAQTITEAGLNVIRDPIEGFVNYRSDSFDATYMNWLVGNGFVITVGFGNPELDNAAKSRLEEYFPGRDVYVIEMLASWYAGGGVHCHTNDQPAASLPATQ